MMIRTRTGMLSVLGFLAVALLAQPSTQESMAVVLAEVPVQAVSRDGIPIDALARLDDAFAPVSIQPLAGEGLRKQSFRPRGEGRASARIPR